METIQISWFNKGLYKTKDEKGNTVMKPQLPRNDNPVKVVPLKDLWLWQEKMNPKSPKGTSGMIFPFAFDKMYSIDYISENNLTSNGTVFIDIDCGAEMAAEIYAKIPEINEVLYSSMICASQTAKGIHILFLSDPLTASQYTERNFYMLAAFAYATQKVTGIDLNTAQWPDPETGELHGCLDTCTFTMKQRLWLRYCKKVYWFDNPVKTVPSASTQAELRRLYPDLYAKARGRLEWDTRKKSGQPLPDTRCSATAATDTPKHPYIDHYTRWRLFRSLCCCFRDNEDELWRQWERCCDLMEEGNGHSKSFFLKAPHANHWLRDWDKQESHQPDTQLLREFGYTIENRNTVYVFHRK